MTWVMRITTRRKYFSTIPIAAAFALTGSIGYSTSDSATECSDHRLRLRDKLHALSDANLHRYKDSSKWKLRQSYVVLRHGARTPVFSNPMVDAVNWSGLCDQINHPPGLVGFSTIQGSGQQDSVRFAHLHVVDEQTRGGRPVSRVDEIQSSQVMPGGGTCRIGQLTDVGARQAAELGKEIKSRYETLGLIGTSETPFGVNILARSTNVARCVATLAAVLGSILPKGSRQSEAVEVTTRSHKEENLTPNSKRCKNMKLLLDAARNSRNTNPSDEAKELVSILKTKLSTETFESLQLDRFNFIRIRDILAALETHGIPNPYGLDEELVTRICDQGTKDIANYCHQEGDYWEHAVNLGLGRYLRELRDLMFVGSGKMHPPPDGVLSKAKGPLLYLVSAHDTTILPLLISLHLFDGKWPKFCSSVAFELYTISDDDDDDQVFVKVLYDFKEQLLLTLEEFSEYVDMVSRDDWSEECEKEITGIQDNSNGEAMGVGGSHF